MSAAAFQLLAWSACLQTRQRNGNQAGATEAMAMCRDYANFIIQRSAEPLLLF